MNVYEEPALYDAEVADEDVDHPRNWYPDLVGVVDDSVIDFEIDELVAVVSEGAPDPPLALYLMVKL